jgi:hypothetical protein
MSKTTYHKHCKLVKNPEPDVRIITHSWIPAKYAQVGRVLDLRDEDGNWDRGWAVEEVWGTRSTTEALAQTTYYRNHRKGTDAHRDGEDGWETPHGRPLSPVS